MVSAPLHPRDWLPKEAPFLDGEIRRFEISIEEFDECVKEISGRLEKIHAFLYFARACTKRLTEK